MKITYIKEIQEVFLQTFYSVYRKINTKTINVF